MSLRSRPALFGGRGARGLCCPDQEEARTRRTSRSPSRRDGAEIATIARGRPLERDLFESQAKWAPHRSTLSLSLALCLTWCTNKSSSSGSDGVMKPKPLVELNHLQTPVRRAPVLAGGAASSSAASPSAGPAGGAAAAAALSDCAGADADADAAPSCFSPSAVAPPCVAAASGAAPGSADEEGAVSAPAAAVGGAADPDRAASAGGSLAAFASASTTGGGADEDGGAGAGGTPSPASGAAPAGAGGGVDVIGPESRRRAARIHPCHKGIRCASRRCIFFGAVGFFWREEKRVRTPGTRPPGTVLLFCL